MRVLLISANREEINMPTLPMGLGCVAASAQRAGHDVKFVDLLTASDFEPVIRKAVDEFNAQVIGISIRNIDDQVMNPTHFMLNQAKRMFVKDLEEWLRETVLDRAKNRPNWFL
jgi:hypothetical protein